MSLFSVIISGISPGPSFSQRKAFTSTTGGSRLVSHFVVLPYVSQTWQHTTWNLRASHATPWEREIPTRQITREKGQRGCKDLHHTLVSKAPIFGCPFVLYVLTRPFSQEVSNRTTPTDSKSVAAFPWFDVRHWAPLQLRKAEIGEFAWECYGSEVAIPLPNGNILLGSCAFPMRNLWSSNLTSQYCYLAWKDVCHWPDDRVHGWSRFVLRKVCPLFLNRHISDRTFAPWIQMGYTTTCVDRWCSRYW